MGRKNRKSSRQENTNEFEVNDYNNADDLSSNYTIATETTLEDLSETNANEINTDTTINENAVQDALSDLADLTLERKQRSSKHREKVYRNVFKALSQHGFENERGLERIDMVAPTCLIGVTRTNTSPSEQYAALRCLETLPILLGSSDGEGYLDEVYEPLVETIHSETCTKVRSVALRVITMAAFICGTNNVINLDGLLDLCQNLTKSYWRNATVPNPLRCAAFDCWSILSTLLDGADIVTDGIGKGLSMLEPIKDALNSSDVELRESAGKCFVLIHEHRLNLAEHSDRWTRGSWHDSEAYLEIEDLITIIQELSLESSHYISRKAKKNQKKIFREIYSTLEDNDNHVVSDIVTTASTTLTLNSWNQIHAFNFIKQCLQSGLHHHLQYNALLYHLLSLDYQDNTATLSNVEKRLTMSKTSDKVKAKDRDMIRRRRSRNNAKNLFILDDA